MTTGFMLAGCMGEISPRNPESNSPYYLKVEEAAALSAALRMPVKPEKGDKCG